MILRFLLFAACILFYGTADAQMASGGAPATSAAPLAPGTAPDPAVEMLRQAYVMLNQNDLDGAMAKLNASIKLNPKILSAYIMRGGVYYAKKDWANSEADFKTASAMDPNNIVIKFQIAEIAFQQKQYDRARPLLLAMESDPTMGDLAAYKVFLCDVQGGHTDDAAKEFAVFNAAESHPSYYFANAVWSLQHHNVEEARGWLTSAAGIYIPGKNQLYAQPLKDLGYLPLPTNTLTK